MTVTSPALIPSSGPPPKRGNARLKCSVIRISFRPLYDHSTVMEDRIIKLAEKARRLPKAPGVYLMKDAAGVVIYVGKSASLRDRVGSYFLASTKLGEKEGGAAGSCCRFRDYPDRQRSRSALDRKIGLSRIFSRNTTPGCSMTKTYPYLMVTTKDEFPGVFVTRVPQPNAKLYGPFTSVYAAERGGHAPAEGIQVPHLPSGDQCSG